MNLVSVVVMANMSGHSGRYAGWLAAGVASCPACLSVSVDRREREGMGRLKCNS